MDDNEGSVLSVRAEVHRWVSPDTALLAGSVRVERTSKAQALAEASVAVENLVHDLHALGGVAAIAEDRKRPLAWSVQSVTTHTPHQKHADQLVTDGVVAEASVRIQVRDFALLDDVGAALAAHEAYQSHSVGWQVDRDNPAWTELRSATVGQAIQKARDYAAALHTELLRLDHLADTGLLGSQGGSGFVARGLGWSGSTSEPSQAPSLDPVPQELSASIEARFTMGPVPMDAGNGHQVG